MLNTIWEHFPTGQHHVCEYPGVCKRQVAISCMEQTHQGFVVVINIQVVINIHVVINIQVVINMTNILIVVYSHI